MKRMLLSALCLLTMGSSLTLVGCGGGADNSSAPTVTLQSSSQTAIAGGSVTLSATASDGTATYQWYKGDSQISGATSSSLTINPTSTSDSGSYYVVVTNSAGSATSAIITLTITPSTGSSSVTVE
jgi:Immunoglobulin domain